METIIYLIRHSKSLGKNDIKFNTNDSEQIINEKLPLSTIGEEMAKELSTWNEFNKIDYVFTSNYVRAISTGKYIALKNNIPIVVDQRLNERKIGDAKNVGKEFWLTQLNDKDAKLPNGESRNETCERMLSFINEAIKEYKGKK
jgi:Fructose-2,6-bisphosphatase